MSDELQTEEPAALNHRDVAAYALLFCILFVAIALATYDPADALGPLIAPFDRLYRQDTLVSPPNDEIHNQCGWWGALIADLLLTTFGVGAYVIVAGLAYLDFRMLRRRSLDTLGFRLLGAAVSMAGITGFATLAIPDWSPGPVLGSGGAVGALVGWALERHFATTGGLILCASTIIAGMLVATDCAVYRAAAIAGGAVAGKGMLRSRRLNRPATDIEDELAEGIAAETGAGPAIKIRGAKIEAAEEDEGDEGDEADEEEAWDDEAWDEAEDEDDAAEDEVEDEEPEDDDAAEGEKEIVVKTPQPKSKSRGAGDDSPSEREQVFAELNDVDFEEDDDYELPGVELLVAGDEVSYDAQRKELAHKAKLLEKTFQDFGLNVRVVEIETGPVIAQYEIELEPGLRLSKITNLADDIAIALRVPSVRIVSPIPGKNTVGIEVPNAKRQMVRLRDVIDETDGRARKMKIPLFLGQDVSGNPMAVDLAKLPHLLIAGRTGTGKSVCLNAIISSILMTKRPDEVRMLMIDPKMVELSGYGRLPHLMHPVVTDMKKAEAILAWAVDKMEERYSLLARAGVRHISSYNQLGEEVLMERLGVEDDEEWEEIPQHLPFIVIIADEMADLMMTAGKEVEQHIIRLAQKSRAVGIHLILATQKPTVDVITGLIKSNLPARISFQVASRTDSRVVLDEMGAEKLLGNGDMLFLWPGTSTLLRGQGTYLGDEEIDRVVDAVSTGEQNFVNELVNMNVATSEGEDRMEELRKRDDLYESAIEVVVREQRGSCSLLQRSLGIGYGRAARLVDFMAEDGIVGSYAGSQARDVLLTMEDWERMQGMEGDGPPDPPPSPPNGPSPAKPPAQKKPSLKTRADSASAPKPKRVTAEAAGDEPPPPPPPPPQRRNRIVLGEEEHVAQLQTGAAQQPAGEQPTAEAGKSTPRIKTKRPASAADDADTTEPDTAAADYAAASFGANDYDESAYQDDYEYEDADEDADEDHDIELDAAGAAGEEHASAEDKPYDDDEAEDETQDLEDEEDDEAEYEEYEEDEEAEYDEDDEAEYEEDDEAEYEEDDEEDDEAEYEEDEAAEYDEDEAAEYEEDEAAEYEEDEAAEYEEDDEAEYEEDEAAEYDEDEAAEDEEDEEDEEAEYEYEEDYELEDDEEEAA